MKKKSLLLSLLMAVTLGVSPILNAQDIESGLVVYYPLDGDGVSGVGGPEAELKSANAIDPVDIIPVIGFNGVEDGALQFDGETDKVTAPDTELDGLPIGAEERTFACWALIEADGGSIVLMNYGTPGESPRGGHVHFAYRPAEGGLGRVRVGHWYADYDWDEVALADSTWHHLAFTFDGDEFYLYIDGQYVPVDDENDSHLVNPELAEVNTTLNGEFAIGARNVPESQDAILGCLDEVRIYNRVLSDDDIAALYAFDPAAGVNAVESQVSSNFTISPNPATDYLNIRGIEIGSAVSLLNVVGQEVHSGIASTTEYGISLSELKSGMYIVKANGTSQKLIIK